MDAPPDPPQPMGAEHLLSAMPHEPPAGKGRSCRGRTQGRRGLAACPAHQNCKETGTAKQMSRGGGAARPSTGARVGELKRAELEEAQTRDGARRTEPPCSRALWPSREVGVERGGGGTAALSTFEEMGTRGLGRDTVLRSPFSASPELSPRHSADAGHSKAQDGLIPVAGPLDSPWAGERCAGGSLRALWWGSSRGGGGSRIGQS